MSIQHIYETPRIDYVPAINLGSVLENKYSLQIESVLADIEQIRKKSHVFLRGRLDIAEKGRKSRLPWRGQFSPELVDYFLDLFVLPGMLVLDPFCGSGTVLYECIRRQINSFGADVNPVAYIFSALSMLSGIKKTRVDEIFLRIKDLAQQAVVKESIDLPRELLGGLDCNILSEQIRWQKNTPDLQLIASAIFLISASNKEVISSISWDKAVKIVKTILEELPEKPLNVKAELSDARTLSIDSGEVDLVITSPPYINVFNYHQNCRHAVELLGWLPLNVAPSEIGANRKHRQNRFLTVIQYCMDIAQTMVELHRVLKRNGKVIFVVGRISHVRGVKFENGKLIALIASSGLGFNLEQWEERSFLNRFGEIIYEDVLVFNRANKITQDPTEVGGHIGKWALEQASSENSSIMADINDARKSCVSPSRILRISAPLEWGFPIKGAL